MIPDVVVDVGNTRIKWGRCGPHGLAGAHRSLPADASDAWQQQIDSWRLPSPATWVVTGVHPARRDRLAAWLRRRGDHVRVIDSPEELPLRVLLDEPQKVGIDRLFSAVGANYLRPHGTPAVIISSGTAVTVDLVDESGAFRGGAILPGFHMMARALHEHTALLPLIDPLEGPICPELPGTSTSAAMRAGIFYAVAGGVRALVERYAQDAGQPPDVWVTGGDYHEVAALVGGTASPELTLRGIFLTAESLS
jgi:type III pantothenate kinase